MSTLDILSAILILAILLIPCTIGAVLLFALARKAIRELRQELKQARAAHAAGHLVRQAIRYVRSGKAGL